MPTRTFKLEGKVVSVDVSLSKADMARRLLDEGISVSAISKVVPMAYSQVHSISKKLTVVGAHGPRPKAENERWRKASRSVREVTRIECDSSIDFHVIPHSKGCTRGQILSNKRRAKELEKPKLGRRGTGKLRVPGLPLDLPAGKCANCSFDLLVKKTPTGYILAHSGMSAEEYLSTVQFCKAVPESLV